MSVTLAPAFVRLFSINCATAALSAVVFKRTRLSGPARPLFKKAALTPFNAFASRPAT